MRMQPCQIGSKRPRRQARERRTLHTSKTKVPSGKQRFQRPNGEDMCNIWKFDCDGGDECECDRAKSAAIVRDAKPESDVHSILPKINVTSGKRRFRTSNHKFKARILFTHSGSIFVDDCSIKALIIIKCTVCSAKRYGFG